MFFSRSQKFLIFLFVIILILSYPIGNGDHLLNWGFFSILISGFSEINILEISQALILLFTILETFSFRNIIIKKFNFLSLFLRLSMLVFLFYEEISFVTKGLFTFTKNYNSVNQLNIHNSLVGRELVLNNIQIPFSNYQFNISLYVLTLLLATLFIGFGGFIKLLKGIKFFFIDRKYCLFFLIYFFNIVLRSILFKLDFIDTDSFIHNELLEFYLYSVLLIDTLYKKRKLSNKVS